MPLCIATTVAIGPPTDLRASCVILFAIVTCGVIAAAAGLLQSSQLGTGDPTIGPPYLLPTIAAVFLGSTQFRGGRYNVWGTVLGTYVLATGVAGLQLAGAPTWIPDVFDGAALLFAVGLAGMQRSPTARTAAIRRALHGIRRPTRRRPHEPDGTHRAHHRRGQRHRPRSR